MSKKDTMLITAVDLAAAFTVPSLVSYVRADSSSNHWQIGHDDACNSGQVASGPHTQDYMNGFNQGLRDCGNNNSPGPSSSSSGSNTPIITNAGNGYQDGKDAAKRNFPSVDASCPLDFANNVAYCTAYHIGYNAEWVLLQASR